MNRFLVRIIVAGMLVIGWSGSAAADWKLDIGYTALQTELGSAMPTGAGVKVTQVEASGGKPDPSNAAFAGDTFTLKTPGLTVSSHATTVGQYFYGNSSSIAPGITNIDCYDASRLDRLRVSPRLFIRPPGLQQPGGKPQLGRFHSTPQVMSISWLDWIGWSTGMNISRWWPWRMAESILRCWAALSMPLPWGSAMAAAAHGSYPLATTPTTPYAAAGTRPDLVAPASATSWATPMVSSAAALLVEVGHKGGNTLSTDPAVKFTTNRNGDKIYNAERSEVVKAALMAGASRTSPNLTNSVTPKGYTVNTANGLNNIYGAGQLNIDNSYHIIAAGEQNSREDFIRGNGEIKSVGFDYDPAFGGVNGSNKTGSYVFKALTTGSLAASLVWNLNVKGETASGFDTSATLYNLGLALYDMTSSSEVAYAASLVDNTENIWYTSLLQAILTCLRSPPCKRPISSGTTAWPGILRQPPPTPPCPPPSICWVRHRGHDFLQAEEAG